MDDEIRNLQLFNAEKVDNNIAMIANILGYKTMPVDIDTFMDDPYYMGTVSKNLYPFWREILRKIYPTPIHTRYPIIVFTGAIGTGKSTCVRFMAEYMKYRISCLRNPYDTFGFVPGKNLKFSYFHRTGALAQTDFVDVMNSWEEMSPCFSDTRKTGRLDLIEQVCDSIRSNNNIGSDVLFYNLSELNFINYDSAHFKLDQALKRFDSRFGMICNYFGNVIIDTSSQGDDSIADNFINTNPYGDKVLSVHTNQWIVREHLHYYGQKGWFEVYCGDSTHQPFIVNRDLGRIITQDLDPDRVIKVPEELRPDFEFDLVTALQDKAGVSVTSSDKFIPNFAQLENQFTLPQYSSDIVKFSMFDKTDKFIYRFDKAISEIPKDKIIYIRTDIGVVNDHTGLAIAYFDHWKVYDLDNKVKLPVINIPLAVAIGRYDGEETSIDHIYEFILDLNNRFEVGCFTADQFASRQLFQSLTRDGIKNQYLSVDRTDTAYILTKSLMTRNLLFLPNNSRLKTEFGELKRIGNKIDHPEGGSKDIADAVAGVVQNLYDNLDQAGQLSNKYKVNSYSNQIKDRTKTNDDVFKEMLKGIYG